MVNICGSYVGGIGGIIFIICGDWCVYVFWCIVYFDGYVCIFDMSIE